jgi:dTDP-4-amino-4,6-dideoxygalactose transaminase
MGGQEMKFIREAFDSNYIAPLGPQVDALEKEFSHRFGFEQSAALSSGTAAMHLALDILGVGPGDQVLAPSLTFIGGVSPICFLGAQPVFIDSDLVSWNLDSNLLAEELLDCAARNHLPKAVVSADIYGQSADLDRILDICAPYDIPVVSDSAEALGARYKDRHAGKGARATVFSFNGNKIITTSGGGLLASDDAALIEKARFLSQQARDPGAHYEHTRIGYNYRMSNILAALGLGQLQVLEERVAGKRRVFDYYQKALSDLPGLTFMPEADFGICTRWLTVVLLDPGLFGVGPEQVRLALEKENIESRPVWKPMHMQPVFKGCRHRGGAVSERLFAQGLCLPSGTALTDSDLDRIVGIIRGMAGK